MEVTKVHLKVFLYSFRHSVAYNLTKPSVFCFALVCTRNACSYVLEELKCIYKNDYETKKYCGMCEKSCCVVLDDK